MAARLRALTVLLATLALSAGPARALGDEDPDGSVLEAGDPPVTLTADSLEYESQRELYVARGNVVIVQGERTLKADWMAFNPETGAGVASGNVELIDGDDTLRADFIEFDIDNLEGVIHDGSLDSPSSRFRTSGEEIEKIGENTYRFRRGVFSTCRCPEDDAPDPWEIRAEEAEVEIGGYGTMKDATIAVLGVPVLWLPWMIYPIKTERESGFLFPDFSVGSRKGFGLGLPFFWAARENVNVTVTPRWSVKEGFRGDAEIEYLLGEESRGQQFGSYAYDQDIDPNSLDDPFDRNRWVASGEHDLFLPWETRFQTDFLFVSDNQATLDWDEISSRRADRFLESVASLSRDFGATGRFGAVGSAFYARDQQNPDDVDRTDFLLQRLPQLELRAPVGGIPGVPLLRPSLDANYINLAQIERPPGVDMGSVDMGFVDTGVDGVINSDERLTGPGPPPDPHADNAATVADGTEGNGLFEEGELLTDSGSRVLLQPRLAAPFRLGRFAEVYPEVGWHQTFYDTREQSSAQRGLLTGRVDLRSRLRRTYGDRVHVVEPFVGWAYVSGTNQSGNPLLIPPTALPQERIRSLDLDAVTRNPSDRIERANQLTFGVTQRLFGAEEDEVGTRLRADATLLGLYDFETDAFEDLVLDGRIADQRFGRLRFNMTVDPSGGNFEQGLAEWAWNHSDGHRLDLGYLFLREVPNVFEDFGRGRFDNVRDEDRASQMYGSIKLALTRHISVSYRLAYSFASNTLLANEGTLGYISRCECWAAGFEVEADRARGFEVKFVYRLVGLGNDEAPSPGGLLDW